MTHFTKTGWTTGILSIAIAAMATVFGVHVASASTSDPHISGVANITATTMDVGFDLHRWRNSPVTAIVWVEPEEADNGGTTKMYRVTLDDHGAASVHVTGLSADTKYEVKVQLMNPAVGRTTGGSNERHVRTTLI